MRAMRTRRRRGRPDVFVGELRIEALGSPRELGAPQAPVSGREYDLLLELARDPGAVHSKADLLREIWRMPATSAHAPSSRTPVGCAASSWRRACRGSDRERLGARLSPRGRAMRSRRTLGLRLEARLSVAVAVGGALALSGDRLLGVAAHPRSGRAPRPGPASPRRRPPPRRRSGGGRDPAPLAALWPRLEGRRAGRQGRRARRGRPRCGPGSRPRPASPTARDPGDAARARREPPFRSASSAIYCGSRPRGSARSGSCSCSAACGCSRGRAGGTGSGS